MKSTDSIQLARLHILAPALSTCVTMAKLPNLSTIVLICKMGRR